MSAVDTALATCYDKVMSEYQKGPPANTDASDDWQAGQALLIVVLIMVVALTIGLSVAGRVITNSRTATEQENSQRAFSAAEAGIEQALTQGDLSPLSGQLRNASYTTTIADLTGNDFLLNNGISIRKDAPVDIWLSTYPDYTSPWSGNLTINWGTGTEVCNSSENSNTQAALDIVIISGTKVNPLLSHYALDPCSPRSAINKFEYVSTPGSVISGKAYAYKKTIIVSSGLIARVIPLYAPTIVAVEKGSLDSNLPSQGKLITSVGVSDTTQRKVVSFQGYPSLPAELFPYVLFVPK